MIHLWFLFKRNQLRILHYVFRPGLAWPLYCIFLFVARCEKSTISASSICLPKSKLRIILLVFRVNQSRCEQKINLYAWFKIMFGYNARCHWLKERALWGIEYRAELKLSRHLPNCTMFDLFQDFFLAFFDNWKWNFGTSEPQQKNQTKVCKHTSRCNLRY